MSSWRCACAVGARGARRRRTCADGAAREGAAREAGRCRRAWRVPVGARRGRRRAVRRRAAVAEAGRSRRRPTALEGAREVLAEADGPILRPTCWSGAAARRLTRRAGRPATSSAAARRRHRAHVSPPLFASLELLGRDRSLARVDAALAKLGRNRRMTEPPPEVSRAPRLDELHRANLVVPIRSSSGGRRPWRVGPDAFRHGADGRRALHRGLPAPSLREFGPPGSDHVRCRPATSSSAPRRPASAWSSTPVPRRRSRSPSACCRSWPPGSIRTDRTPCARAARSAPAAARGSRRSPRAVGAELRAALRDLPQVERAWLLRAGDAWTAGIQLGPDAVLGDFDAVRNRLHAVATEHLGSRRALAVTDLRAPSLREEYDATRRRSTCDAGEAKHLRPALRRLS